MIVDSGEEQKFKVKLPVFTWLLLGIQFALGTSLLVILVWSLINE
jgi:hypothetical protein